MDKQIEDALVRDLQRRAEAEKKANKYFQEQPAVKTSPRSTGDQLLDDVLERERALDFENKRRIAAIKSQGKIPLTSQEKAVFRSSFAAEQSAKRQCELSQAQLEKQKQRVKQQAELDDLI